MTTKILIIRFSSIGDIVLTTPVIRNLKLQGESIELHYLTKKQHAGILENNPYVDKVHILDKSFSDLIPELRAEQFNYIIDLHKNLRTLKVKRSLKVESFSFNKINWEKWLIVNLKINKLPDIHIVDRYMETIKLFVEKNDMQGLDYFIPATDEVTTESLPVNFHAGYIAFAIGAQHTTKRLSINKIISICKKTDLPIILLGDNNDAIIAKKIVAAVGNNIYNACGKYNLNQSASVVKQAKIVITHDTGLMHIAAAFKKKIISVWGNTIPEFGMSPYLAGEGSEKVEVKGLKCRPCSKIGFNRCPKKHFKCMNDIDEEKIILQAQFQTEINSE